MTHITHSANACHPPSGRHNDGDAVRLQNDATHSPHKQSNDVVGESEAPKAVDNINGFVSDVENHVHYIDRRVEITGTFTRAELSLILCNMPDDADAGLYAHTVAGTEGHPGDLRNSCS